MTDNATVERVADGLHANGWGTVMARWFQFEGPGQDLSEERLEQVARVYLRLIASDALAAVEAAVIVDETTWEGECEEFGCHGQETGQP